MPMYEYRCGGCGHKIERYEAGRAASEGAEKCPECGRTSLRRVFSTFASNCCGDGDGGGSLPASGGCGGGSSHFS
ncbi:MAG TPA: zinc ribbon domain-containing protein [bacterium]